MKYAILFSKQAQNDYAKLTQPLKLKVNDLVKNILEINPYVGKKLIGDLQGLCSLCISYKDRLVYRIVEKEKTIQVMLCKTHYRK